MRAAGLIAAVGVAGFVAAQAVGMTPARSAATTTPAPATTLPTPDPPPVTKPKAPARAPRHVQKKPAHTPARVSPPPPPAPTIAQTTTAYVPPPPPAAVQTAAPKNQPAASHRKAAARRHARVVHKAPKRTARHHRPRPQAAGVLAQRAARVQPNVAAVTPAGSSGKGLAWLIMLSLLAAPLLLVLASALPSEQLPARVATVVDPRRSDLAVGGLVGFGTVLFAWLIAIALGSGGP